METEKKARGGRRDGAGRKPKDNRTQTVAFSIQPELFERIVNSAKERGISRSQLIVEAIETYLRNY